jgi:hypothetical protein
MRPRTDRYHHWRRGDGAVMSCSDLHVAVPMLLDELDDIKRLVDQLEDWLRFDEAACDLLTDWLWAVNCSPEVDPTAQQVIDALGRLSVQLGGILRAGVADTGHIHPPTT